MRTLASLVLAGMLALNAGCDNSKPSSNTAPTPIQATASVVPKIPPIPQISRQETRKEQKQEQIMPKPQETSLILQREGYSPESITGSLYLDTNSNGEIDTNDEKLAYTLEPPYRNNQNNSSSIPEGQYPLTPRTSAKFNQHFLVDNVPNRQYILIHAGNYPKDTMGCILVGSIRGKDYVGNSRKTLAGLRTRLKGKNLTLKITGNSRAKS